MQCSKSRRLGVLLHPTALPESPVCGGFGAEARHWLQAMARHGIHVWQVLPLAVNFRLHVMDLFPVALITHSLCSSMQHSCASNATHAENGARSFQPHL